MLILVDRTVPEELARCFTAEEFQDVVTSLHETGVDLIRKLAATQPGSEDYRRLRHDLRPLAQQFGLTAFWRAFDRLEADLRDGERRAEAVRCLDRLFVASLTQLRCLFPADEAGVSGAPAEGFLDCV